MRYYNTRILITLLIPILLLISCSDENNYRNFKSNINHPLNSHSSLLKSKQYDRQIYKLQLDLFILGYNPGPLDGVYGPKTKAAVVRFQRDHGLIPDGIVGPRTLACLNAKIIRPFFDYNVSHNQASLIYLPASNYRHSNYNYRYVPRVAENGSYYGEISEYTGRPKTVYVRGYFRRDGTYVRSHFRSPPRKW